MRQPSGLSHEHQNGNGAGFEAQATLPAEGVKGVGKKGEKPSGLLGFMNRKGGRARSPKPKEAGVLGKEGARVVVK
jgi:hypothetical protein